MLKNKRVLLVVSAIVFLALIFTVKNKEFFFSKIGITSGLSYGDLTLGELVNQDSDGDGLFDWEETLQGTNPQKIDSDDDGIGDKEELATLTRGASANVEAAEQEEETLTQTDILSRELFATAVALNQAGEVREDSAEKLAESINEQIRNITPKKVFLISEIKSIPDNSAAAMQKYITDLNNIYKKYPPPEQTVLDVLAVFTADEEETNPTILSELDPIITQTEKVLGEMLIMNVPSTLAPAHLDVMNSLQRLKENVADIQLFEVDSVVAMGAISKYEENSTALSEALSKMGEIINAKIGN